MSDQPSTTFNAGNFENPASDSPAPHVVRKAFSDYQVSERYKSTRQFALMSQYVDTALWDAFAKGWLAARADVPEVRTPYAWEVTQDVNTRLVSAQEFTRSTYDRGSFKQLFE